MVLIILLSALTDGAWEGRLVHLSGVDVLGATAGSLSRLVQDREQELWEGRRLVAHADAEEVGSSMCLVIQPLMKYTA